MSYIYFDYDNRSIVLFLFYVKFSFKTNKEILKILVWSICFIPFIIKIIFIPTKNFASSSNWFLNQFWTVYLIVWVQVIILRTNLTRIYSMISPFTCNHISHKRCVITLINWWLILIIRSVAFLVLIINNILSFFFISYFIIFINFLELPV